MFIRTTDQAQRPNSLADLGMTSGSDQIVSISEFTYKKGTEIFGEGEPAEYVYQVKQGAVRRYKLLADGRRQIGAFHLAGDIFGLENNPTHRLTAEAVIETTVRLIKRESLEVMAGADPVVLQNLLTMTTSNLRHVGNHLLLLGRKSSFERVAAFLLEMDARLVPAGSLSLPMSRRDIADYLGLTLETVSRVMSQLHAAGLLQFLSANQRDIMLTDKTASLDVRITNEVA